MTFSALDDCRLIISCWSCNSITAAYLCQQLISSILQVIQFARSLVSFIQVLQHDDLHLLHLLLPLLQATLPILLPNNTAPSKRPKCMEQLRFLFVTA